MANDLESIAMWIFDVECDIPKDVEKMLTPGEVAECAYKTIRDVAIFTNKRLIVRDAQGLTGKKIEIYSLPYNSIIMYSSENAGIIDFTSEIELWTKAGPIKINLSKNVDIRKLEYLIASHIL